MVVKTEICNFTEYKIYPGHGQKFIGKDSKLVWFISRKAEQLWHQKIKAAKLTWTQAWRRMNKKAKIDSGTRRKRTKTVKAAKAIAGLSLEDMRRKRANKDTLRKEAKQDAVEEAKKRVQKKKSGNVGGAGGKQKAKAPVTKNVPQGQKKGNTKARR